MLSNFKDVSTINQLFESQVESTPAAVAVVFEGEQLNYQSLNRRSNQLAHYLRTLGVGPEVLVGICVERSLEMIVGILGILKAGGAYVPLDPAYPQERLAFMLEDAQVSVLLAQQRTLNSLPVHQARAICLDADGEAIARQSEDNLVNEVTLDNSAYVMYTSGSTSRPKGVLVTDRGLCNLVKAQQRLFKWSEERKIQHLQRIASAVKHMTQLLNDVLLIGKAEAGKLEFNPTSLDLLQFCHDLVEEIQLATSRHTIAFCSEGDCTTACMDEKLLRHILSNLLSNAVKYSPKGGPIYFDLVCAQGKASFHVQDRGIGIPEADIAQLFNSFHRAVNVGNISGTGLGLAIVKKSVDLHGGFITVKSEIGVGTKFTVTLPLNH